ncbi:hypothetical protein Naga_101471g2, partial [Nannochloropsis gaditana]
VQRLFDLDGRLGGGAGAPALRPALPPDLLLGGNGSDHTGGGGGGGDRGQRAGRWRGRAGWRAGRRAGGKRLPSRVPTGEGPMPGALRALRLSFDLGLPHQHLDVTGKWRDRCPGASLATALVHPPPPGRGGSQTSLAAVASNLPRAPADDNAGPREQSGAGGARSSPLSCTGGGPHDLYCRSPSDSSAGGILGVGREGRLEADAAAGLGGGAGSGLCPGAEGSGGLGGEEGAGRRGRRKGRREGGTEGGAEGVGDGVVEGPAHILTCGRGTRKGAFPTKYLPCARVCKRNSLAR